MYPYSKLIFEVSWRMLLFKFWLNPLRHNINQPQGGYSKYTWWGGSNVFVWVENLHARYFSGSRDLSHIFLSLKKICVFFWVLSLSELFVSGFRCDQWIRKIIIWTFFQRRVFRVLVFFWVGNFDARYFFGSKISGLCIFLGLQYEAPSGPPVMYTSSTPLGNKHILLTILLIRYTS